MISCRSAAILSVLAVISFQYVDLGRLNIHGDILGEFAGDIVIGIAIPVYADVGIPCGGLIQLVKKFHQRALNRN